MKRAVKRVPLINPKRLQLKRVAAYARVSSGKDAMLHSLSAQVSYYSELIQSHRAWQYAGVYTDEALTGTKDNRAGFQKMLSDCRSGMIDMVITKSISRFARNTVTLLETVRELKALGVDVFFQEQNIHTLSADGELMLSILASYAQEESLSTSENQKWRIRKNFEEGKPWNGTMLGYRYEDGTLTVVPEEAEVVRFIFKLYLGGLGFAGIMKRLNQQGIGTRNYKQWCRNGLMRVLSNYTYTGNLLLQQTYTDNHITKRRMVNSGQLPKYHATATHEAIIDNATFDAVQQEMERRAERYASIGKKQNAYPFTSLIKCGICGKHYNRKSRPSGAVWICNTYNIQGKAACGSKQIPETTLMAVACEVLGEDAISADALHSRLTAITAEEGNTLVFHPHQGTSIVKRWQDRSRAESWTAEMRDKVRQANYERSQTK